MRSRRNGGLIGKGNTPTSISSSGIWSQDDLTSAKETAAPSTSFVTTRQKTITTKYPNVGAIDPYYSTVRAQISDADYTNFIHKDQSGNNWHDFAAVRYQTRHIAVSFNGPAHQHWSTQFDENGFYYIDNTVTALQFGAGNFTIEFWVKLARQDATQYYIMGRGGNAGVTSGTGWTIFVSSTYQFGFYDAVGNLTVTTTAGYSRDRWYHVAFVRSSTAASGFTIYVDGAVAATGQVSGTFSDANTFFVGRDRVGTQSTGFFGGKITDLRIMGSAMYSAAFARPSAPLSMTGAIFSHSMTVPHNDLAGLAQPEGRNVQYNTGTMGRALDGPFMSHYSGSVYNPIGNGYHCMWFHNGQGFKIYDNPNSGSPGSATSLKFGTSPFTVEGWFFITHRGSGASHGMIGGKGTGTFNGVGTGWCAWYDDTQLHWTDTSTVLNSTVTYKFGTSCWHHIAFVREGTGANQFKMYIDGKNVYTGTVATNYTETGPLGVGVSRQDDYSFTGGMSQLRYSNVARYTANFTPSTTSITSDANTILLMGAMGNEVAKPGCHQVMDYGRNRNNWQWNSNELRYGHVHPTSKGGVNYGSMYFANANNDTFVAITNANDFTFGTGNFSIEFWYMTKWQNSYNDPDYLIDMRRWFIDDAIAIRTGQFHNTIDVFIGQKIVLTDTKNYAAIQQWNHVCVQRAGNALALYINGEKVDEVINSTDLQCPQNRINIANSQRPNIDYGHGFNGWMADLRICKGTAAYAIGAALTNNPDTIAVPTVPLTAVTGTVLLTLNRTWAPRDYSGRNNYVGWDRTEVSYAAWDQYPCNMTPYVSTNWDPSSQIFGFGHDTNAGAYQRDGGLMQGSFDNSFRTDWSFITRMNGPWTIEFFTWWHQGDASGGGSPPVYDILRCANTAGHEGWRFVAGWNGGATANYNNIVFEMYTAHNSAIQRLAATSNVAGIIANTSISSVTSQGLFSHSFNHVAVVYDPAKTNKMAFYINGIRSNTSAAFSPGQKLYSTYNLAHDQMMSGGYRISDIARYDNDTLTPNAAYTIPTTMYTIDSNTVMQTTQLGPFLDRAQAMTCFQYNIYPCTGFKKFGNASIIISNRGDENFASRITWAQSSWNTKAADTDKEDWTFEMWASWWDLASGGKNFPTTGGYSTNGAWLCNVGDQIGVKATAAGYWQMVRSYYNQTEPYYWYGNTTIPVATRTSNTWNHIALSRMGGNYVLWVDGVHATTIPGQTAYTAANATVGGYAVTNLNDRYYDSMTMRVGCGAADYNLEGWLGFVQDIRWSAIARYKTKVINNVATMVHRDSGLPALPTALHPTR